MVTWLAELAGKSTSFEWHLPGEIGFQLAMVDLGKAS